MVTCMSLCIKLSAVLAACGPKFKITIFNRINFYENKSFYTTGPDIFIVILFAFYMNFLLLTHDLLSLIFCLNN